jgi:hypothetical protein
LNPHFARKLLHWSHSGFSIDSGTRIYDEDARRSLSQYIVRAPLSLTSIHWDQDRDTVTWKAPQKGYFKARSAISPAWISSPNSRSTFRLGADICCAVMLRIDLCGVGPAKACKQRLAGLIAPHKNQSDSRSASTSSVG